MRMRLLTKSLCVSLVAAVACAGAAGAATDGKYKGRTKQKKTIGFVVSGNQMSKLRFKINMKCRNGDTLTNTESDFEPISIGANGKFSDDQVGDGGDEVKLSGKVKGSKVKGRVHVTDKLKGGSKCSGATKFGAKRKKAKK